MKVRATQMGYYQNKRRREGAVFTLVPVKKIVLDAEMRPVLDKAGKKQLVVVPPEAQFSHRWMEKYDTPRGKRGAPQPEVQGQDGSEFEDEVQGDEDVPAESQDVI